MSFNEVVYIIKFRKLYIMYASVHKGNVFFLIPIEYI